MAQNENVEANATDATSTSMFESEFSGVIFNNIPDCYPPKQDIECRFTIKPSVKPSTRDWVGLFKVGWQSSREHYTYEWSPLLQDFDGRLPLVNRVVFRGTYLPSADDEFYQFCYVTSAGEIRGASVPFQIKTKVVEPELVCCEIEDEDGCSMLLVKNKTAILEDSLGRALEENAVLKASKETFEEDLAIANENIMDLESRKASLTAQVKEFDEKYVALKKEFEDIEKALGQKCEDWEEEKIRRTELESRLADLESQKTDLSAMLNSANQKVQELSHILEQERSQSSEVAKNKEKLVTEKMQFLEGMAADREMLEKLRGDLKVKGEEVNSLKARLGETRAKAKAEVSNLSAQLEKANGRVIQFQEELAKERNTGDNLRRSTEMEIEKQSKKVREIQNELKSKEQELGRAQVAQDELVLKLAEFQQAGSEIQETKRRELTALTGMLKKLQAESKEKQEIIHRLEDELQDLQGQLTVEQGKNVALEEDYESVVRALEDQLEGQKALNASLCCQSDNNLIQLQTQLQRQLEANADLSHQLEAKTAEVKQLEEAQEKCKKDLDEDEEKVQRAWLQLSAADATVRALTTEKESLQAKLSDCKKESAKQSKASAASMFALQTAHTHLEKKLLQSKKEQENLWRERNDLKRTLANFQGSFPTDDLRHQIEELRAHNEDLRVRLNMGAEAYKMKFIECRKLQSQLKKLQRSNSSESIDISMNADVQSVVSKLRQALDSERELVSSAKLSLDELKERMLQKDHEVLQLTEENFRLRERVNVVVQHEVQQSRGPSQQAVEDLNSKVARLQMELAIQESRLVKFEQDLQTEKNEKESVIHEIVNLQDQLRESDKQREEEASYLEEVRQALLKEQDERDQLGQEARQQLQEHLDREKKLKDRIQRMEAEVDRWKKEVDMHVEAESKLIGASSPEQQETAVQTRPLSPPASPPQQAPAPAPQPSRPFPFPWPRGGPPPPAVNWSTQPWVLVNSPHDQGAHPPPEAPTVAAQTPAQPAQSSAPPVGDTDRECPICKVLFPPNKDLARIQEHVNGHFRD